MGNLASHTNIKVLGKIDLDVINGHPGKSISQRTNVKRGIRLLWATVRDEKKLYDIKFIDKERESEGVGFSLLIGPNGVGKSYILRAIIDFFVDLAYFQKNESMRRRTKIRYDIMNIEYKNGDDIINIRRNGNKFEVSVNNEMCSTKLGVTPNIVAAHFGLYDRFPTSNRNYDLPFYHYVGAKAGGNFITTNNIITQMFFSLCEEKENDVIERLIEVFERIDYEPKVSISGKLKGTQRYESPKMLKEALTKMKLDKSSFFYSAYKRAQEYTDRQWESLYRAYLLLQNKSSKDELLVLDLKKSSFEKNRKIFSEIYLLKQLQIVDRLSYNFYRQGNKVDCNELSSGEANMLATVVSIASSINSKCNLILLDEPELNQHPNWQMGIISLFNDVLKDYPCHFLIATHSHFLVSDLPMNSSSVIQLDYDKENGLTSTMVGEDTYGWSAEEILLQVFHTSTDRNMYFANIVGKLLDRIKDNNIVPDEVEKELMFIKKVSEHLHDNDPMKTISKTILSEFGY